MRYHIDTIPVWDAVKLHGECPLCALRRKNELLEVTRYLGASVMEPDTRIQVNSKGFCAKHHKMLFAQPNKLGHGLMLHTHLKETNEKLQHSLESIQCSSGQASASGRFGRLLHKSHNSEQASLELAETIDALVSSCILCDSLKENMDRYVFTLLHLWKTDLGFKDALKQSKGFCLPDTALLLRAGKEHLHGEALDEFVQVLAERADTNLARLEKEIEWFTLKFDYRNQDKPWGESKDAVERTCNKLRGWCVGEEPNPKED